VIQAIFVGGSVILTLGLLPMVFAYAPPPLSTSLITGTVIGIYGGAFISMRQYASAAGMLAQAAVWAVLAGQAIV
jgi:hypothetical protein